MTPYRISQGSGRLISLAERIAPVYASRQSVAAVFVFGSAAYGFADQFSDLELGVIWNDSPAEAEMRECAKRAGISTPAPAIFLEDKEAWAEEYMLSRVKVEIAHWTRQAIENAIHTVVDLHVVGSGPLLFGSQALVANIQRAHILHGHSLFNAWHARLAEYPTELAVAMVEANLKFGAFGGRAMLAERGEIPLLYENHCRLIRYVTNILFGLNRIYHPSFKWTRQFVEEMSLKPPNLFTRIEQVFNSGPVPGTHVLRSLIEETFDLIELHMPSIELAGHRQEFVRPYI